MLDQDRLDVNNETSAVAAVPRAGACCSSRGTGRLSDWRHAAKLNGSLGAFGQEHGPLFAVTT